MLEKSSGQEWSEVYRQNAKLQQENERLKDLLRSICRILIQQHAMDTMPESRKKSARDPY